MKIESKLQIAKDQCISELQTLNERGLSKSEEYEDCIVRAWNGTLKKGKNAVEKNSIQLVNMLKSGALKAVAKKPADHLGTQKKWEPVSEWQAYGATDKTPKTDIMLGGKKISFKLEPKSQLMSGGKNEATATVMMCIKKSKVSASFKKKAAEIFEGFAESTFTKKGSTSDIIRGKLKNPDQRVLLANKMHLEATKQMNEWMTSKTDLYMAIVKEAASGDIKFGKGSEACAQFILATPEGNPKPSLNSLGNSGYIKKLAGRTNVCIKFKSEAQKSKGKATGKFRYWSVFGLMTEEYEKILDLEYRRDILNESIDEGLIGKIWDKIKSVVSKVKAWLLQSVQNVIDFFGWDVSVTMNNEISFA